MPYWGSEPWHWIMLMGIGVFVIGLLHAIKAASR
jgi:hypothetical protein